MRIREALTNSEFLTKAEMLHNKSHIAELNLRLALSLWMVSEHRYALIMYHLQTMTFGADKEESAGSFAR